MTRSSSQRRSTRTKSTSTKNTKQRATRKVSSASRKPTASAGPSQLSTITTRVFLPAHERKAVLVADGTEGLVSPSEVTCGQCHKRIILDRRSSYSLYHWKKHKERCHRQDKPNAQVNEWLHESRMMYIWLTAVSFQGTEPVHHMHDYWRRSTRRERRCQLFGEWHGAFGKERTTSQLDTDSTYEMDLGAQSHRWILRPAVWQTTAPWSTAARSAASNVSPNVQNPGFAGQIRTSE